MADQKKHRVVVVSPDADTDHLYFDMSKDEALAAFKNHEDWHYMYEPRGIEPKIQEVEFDNMFMLWRNKGNDIATYMTERGLPPELVGLFGKPRGGQ